MSVDTTSLRTRRALLAGGVGGLAALVAASFGRPAAVEAHDPDDVHLGAANSTNTLTKITNNATSGTGLQGVGSGIGVDGRSGSGSGVHGEAAGGIGVAGVSYTAVGVSGYSRYGNGVKGHTQAAANVDFAAIFGLSDGTGSSQAVGVQGRSRSNVGVLGQSETSNAVSGVASADGNGVYGESSDGRGAWFKGKKAQLRLNPSTAASHPSSGLAGDLFVDTSHRLWFCKGGTTWKQLA